MDKEQLVSDYQINKDTIVGIFPTIPKKTKVNIDYINKFFFGHGHYQIELHIAYISKDGDNQTVKYLATTDDMMAIDYWDDDRTEALAIVLRKNEDAIHVDALKYCK